MFRAGARPESDCPMWCRQCRGAIAMAEAGLECSNADIALSVTGVAGPDRDEVGSQSAWYISPALAVAKARHSSERNLASKADPASGIWPQPRLSPSLPKPAEKATGSPGIRVVGFLQPWRKAACRTA